MLLFISRLWRRRFWKNSGLSAVNDALRSLPDEYVVLNDLMLPHGRSVNHFVIGPNGLFLIETKNYSGEVKCEGYEWYVNRRRIPSLTRQAKKNVAALRNGLAQLLPDARAVAAVVVLTNANLTLKLYDPAVPVLRVDQLVEFIFNYRTDRLLAPDFIRAILDHVKSREFKAALGAIARTQATPFTSGS